MRWFGKSAEPLTTSASSDGSERLSEILPLGAIKLDMEAADKEEAFEELVDLLVQTGGVQNREAALEALREREKLGATGIGGGVAIPHGKHETIAKLVAALGISARGIDFGGPDGKPANLIFLLLARTNNPGPHIRALAAIAELVKSQDFVRRITEAKTPREALEIIRAEE